MPDLKPGSRIYTSNPHDSWKGPLVVAYRQGEMIFAYRVDDEYQNIGIIYIEEVTQVQ